MNVAYLGPLKDYSGYGEANRHFVAALDAAGATVMAQLVQYSHEHADFGSIGRTVDRLLANDKPYRIKVLHTTPNEYAKHIEPGKYHIGHFFWETDRVPDEFVAGLELMDEIWTGSDSNKEALLSTGVHKPVHIFPQPIETEREWPASGYQIPGFDGYLFYSVFEWTDRKNPEGLLQAYWQEFQGGENVGLLIKTYYNGFSLTSKNMIREAIQKFKDRSGLDKFPPVYLYLDLMDRQQIMRLHMTGDAYVSPNRGEGWGVPVVEAMLAGHPAITTGFGGVGEWMGTEDGFVLPYELVQLQGMANSRWYDRSMKWADPDVETLRYAMRSCFTGAPWVDQIAANGQKLVQSRFNLQRVGSEMLERLAIIESSL